MNLELLNLPNSGVVAVIGSQWGDEGKGKGIDWLADNWADVIARGTGGANAGHTLNVGDLSIVCHLMLSGVLSGKPCYIGSGVAFEPNAMLEEMAELNGHEVSYDNLRIAFNARLVTPLHIILDRLRESVAGEGKIGTTGRGIGPAYTAHTAREGLWVCDLLNQEVLWQKLERFYQKHHAELTRDRSTISNVLQADGFLTQFYCEQDLINLKQIHRTLVEFGEQLRAFVADTDKLVRQATQDGQRVLLEGAQATLLSIDHGFYPMVTCSDPSVMGLAKGVGLMERQIDRVFAVVKGPYMTRVGEGAFPTELTGAFADAMREQGGEYGATTGRPRRIGWLDLPALRYALQFGGDEIILTKADVLDEYAEIKLCTHYIYRGPDRDFGDWVLHSGDQVDVVPLGDDELMRNMEAQYKIFPGWKQSIKNMRSADELPAELQNIIRFIEDAVDRPISVVSVGPGREETIVRQAA